MEQIQTPFGGTMKLYPAKGTETVLICPGGGYNHLSPRESEPVAEVFRENGYHAVVLDYCLEKKVLGTGPVRELAWAVRWLRSSQDWQGKTEKIWVAGFSAGGHLAASLGALWNEDSIFTEAEQALNRPDGLILGYPVITMKEHCHARSRECLTGGSEELIELFSLEERNLSKMPPVFLWNTLEDEKVPVFNSLLFAQKLAHDGVSCEYHLYHHGLHGLSLATDEVAVPEENLLPDAHVAGWVKLCLEWMQEVQVHGRDRSEG